MIALLKGNVELRFDPYLIVDVHGVGYKVLASRQVLSTVTSIGQTVKIFTYTHVREDILELYGFSDAEDLRLFEMLLSVSGIGPKTAIGVFSVGSRIDILKAIMAGDVHFFTSVPRLGKKNAQKLIIELKSKVGSTDEFDVNAESALESDDVIAALKGFGFSSNEAMEALRLIKQDGLTTSEKIRLALQHLGK